MSEPHPTENVAIHKVKGGAIPPGRDSDERTAIRRRPGRICTGIKMSRARNPQKGSDRQGSVDAILGLRIRDRRIELGFSREAFADAAGLTSDQIDKYEGGQAAISAHRLFAVSELLTVPICAFFESLDSHSGDGHRSDGLLDAPESGELSHLADPSVAMGNAKETLELVRAYYRIGNPQKRANVRAWIANQAGH